MQTTSLQAHQKIKTALGYKQAEVLKVLELSTASLTNSELAKKLGWTINTVVPRTFELREKGLVKEDCKRRCGVTGKTAIAWRIKRPEEIREQQMEMNL